MGANNDKIYVITTAEDNPVKVTFEGDTLYTEDDSKPLASLVNTVSTINIPCSLRPSAMMRMYGIRLKKWQEFILDLEWRIKRVFKR